MRPIDAPDLIGQDFTAEQPDIRWCGERNKLNEVRQHTFLWIEGLLQPPPTTPHPRLLDTTRIRARIQETHRPGSLMGVNKIGNIPLGPGVAVGVDRPARQAPGQHRPPGRRRPGTSPDACEPARGPRRGDRPAPGGRASRLLPPSARPPAWRGRTPGRGGPRRRPSGAARRRGRAVRRSRSAGRCGPARQPARAGLVEKVPGLPASLLGHLTGLLGRGARDLPARLGAGLPDPRRLLASHLAHRLIDVLLHGPWMGRPTCRRSPPARDRSSAGSSCSPCPSVYLGMPIDVTDRSRGRYGTYPGSPPESRRLPSVPPLNTTDHEASGPSPGSGRRSSPGVPHHAQGRRAGILDQPSVRAEKIRRRSCSNGLAGTPAGIFGLTDEEPVDHLRTRVEDRHTPISPASEPRSRAHRANPTSARSVAQKRTSWRSPTCPTRIH